MREKFVDNHVINNTAQRYNISRIIRTFSLSQTSRDEACFGYAVARKGALKRTNHNVKIIAMKKSILSLLFFMLGVAAVAQPEVGTVSIMPRVGVALANLPGDKFYVDADGLSFSSRYKAGLMAGVDVDWQFMRNLSVTLGAYYAQQGAKYGNNDKRISVGDGVYNGTGYSDWSTQLHYINVPLMLNAYIGTGFAMKVGVQFGFPISGKMSFTERSYTQTKDETTYEKPNDVTYDLQSTLTKLTIAIPVGLSYEFSNVVLDARYNIGLTQFQNISDFESSKNSVFTFSVAYRLAL